MSRRYQALDAYRARQLNAAAVGGIHELAATTGYQPAAPAGDDRPDDWHGRPMHLAPFRCDQCDQPFHVRRHLETHACLALTRAETMTAAGYPVPTDEWHPTDRRWGHGGPHGAGADVAPAPPLTREPTPDACITTLMTHLERTD